VTEEQRRIVVIGSSRSVAGAQLLPLEAAGFQLIERTDLDLVEDPATLATGIGPAWATIASGERYTRQLFELVPSLRVIARMGIGFDKVDVEAASDHGVAVLVTPAANADSVADHTLALMLSSLRQLIELDRGVRSGQWRPADPVGDLFRATVGIIGLGSIGRRVAQRLVGFECRLLAHEPFPDRAFCDRLGITLTSLDDLLQRADVVTLHLPLTPETQTLIGERELSLMLPTATIVNTSRGGVIDQQALLRALRDKKIKGAGLDVFEQEPLGLDHPLAKLPNVVLSPHASAYSKAAIEQVTAAVVEGLLELEAGRWPKRQLVVNRDELEVTPPHQTLHA